MLHELGFEFWRTQWQKAADGSRFHEVYPDETCIWNQSARSYDSGMEKEGMRERKLMKILDDIRFEFGRDKRALDIGSGTGALAIPLARRGIFVDALDSSEQMNGVLREKCAAEKIDNINIIAEDFNEYDIPDDSYDLVLGSLNPCLYNPESFLKMLSISREAVVFIGITRGEGTPGHSSEKTLVEQITGISPGHNSSNSVAYPFNMLLSLGLKPAIRHVPNVWRRDEEPGAAIARLTAQYGHFDARYPGTQQVIADYVAQHTTNGKFVELGYADLGIVAFGTAGKGAFFKLYA